LQDVKRVAETYLKAGDGKMAVVAPKAAKETAVQLGLNSEEL